MRSFFICLSMLWSLCIYGAFELTWGLPAVSLGIGPPPGDFYRNVQVVLDKTGNAVAAWSLTEAGEATENIWAAFYHQALRIWTGPVQVSSGANAAHVSIAIDSQGNVEFIWEEGFPAQIYTRTFCADGTWTPPLAFSAEPVSTSLREQSLPKVCVDGAGNKLAVWMEMEKGHLEIYSAFKEKEKDWAAAALVSQPGVAAQLPGKNGFALNALGEGLVVWQQKLPETGRWAIFACHYTKQGWSAPSQISGQDGVQGVQPQVAIDTKGNGIALWLEGHVIFARRFSQGIWGDQKMKVSHPDLRAEHPCLAMDALGHAAVVYTRSDRGALKDPSYKFISASHLLAEEQNWSTPVDISGPSETGSLSSVIGYPTVALNAIGDAVVLWKQSEEGKIVLQGAGFSLGTWSLFQPLSSPKSTVSSPALGYAAAINQVGNMVAIWCEKPEGVSGEQIKASLGVGLAMQTPAPPIPDIALEPEVSKTVIGVGSGKQCLHKFPGHGDLYNVLTWTSSTPSTYFRIYRGHLGEVAGTTTSPYFEDHQREPNKQETYLITAIDADGHESAPATLIVKPLKIK